MVGGDCLIVLPFKVYSTVALPRFIAGWAQVKPVTLMPVMATTWRKSLASVKAHWALPRLASSSTRLSGMPTDTVTVWFPAVGPDLGEKAESRNNR